MSSAITDARYNRFYVITRVLRRLHKWGGWIESVIFNASVAVLVRGRDSEAAQQGAGRSCAH